MRHDCKRYLLNYRQAHYDNLTERDGQALPVARAIEHGHLVIGLHGEKLQGGYVLQRTHGGKRARWLLIKVDDEFADARRNPVSTRPRSVISQRTIEQLADPADPE